MGAIECICVKRVRDKQGVLQSYVLQNKDGKRKTVTADELKKGIRQKKVNVVNLTLTSDDRLVVHKLETDDTKSTPSKQSTQVESEEQVLSDKTLELANESARLIADGGIDYTIGGTQAVVGASKVVTGNLTGIPGAVSGVKRWGTGIVHYSMGTWKCGEAALNAIKDMEGRSCDEKARAFLEYSTAEFGGIVQAVKDKPGEMIGDLVNTAVFALDVADQENDHDAHVASVNRIIGLAKTAIALSEDDDD